MMNANTAETRRLSYEDVKPQAEHRRQLILDILDNQELTASEITEWLLQQGYLPYYDLNFVSPRLTELAKRGKVAAVGKRKCHRTGKTVATWVRIGDER